MPCDWFGQRKPLQEIGSLAPPCPTVRHLHVISYRRMELSEIERIAEVDRTESVDKAYRQHGSELEIIDVAPVICSGLPHRGGPPSMLESGGCGRPAGLTGA